jgi:hypothetical protein
MVYLSCNFFYIVYINLSTGPSIIDVSKPDYHFLHRRKFVLVSTVQRFWKIFRGIGLKYKADVQWRFISNVS